ncbi:MAG TPA: hypothetical protein PLJ21_08495 [Pseudobdellovibrionaceae bacterium]|nr:hypothetical protein [Pseudobdellovibrionaceae bacterium]
MFFIATTVSVFISVFTFLSDMALASERADGLNLCSKRSRETIHATFLSNQDNLGMTSWLSAESKDSKGYLWKFSHLAKVQVASGRYMSWDFNTTARPSAKDCSILEVKKVSENYILPPCENDCEDEQEQDFQKKSYQVSENRDQCFVKNEMIRNIRGSSVLPERVCFSHLEYRELGPSLLIQGLPINGEFPLSFLAETESIKKYMTYIFSQDNVGDKEKMNVAIRTSVDILKDSTKVDYTYLAAEFFVFHDDGTFDTHIYYYSRVKADKKY